MCIENTEMQKDQGICQRQQRNTIARSEPGLLCAGTSPTNFLFFICEVKQFKVPEVPQDPLYCE